MNLRALAFSVARKRLAKALGLRSPGMPPLIVCPVIGVSSLMWLRKQLFYIPGLWLALIGNQLTVTLLKISFARPRPEMAVYAESSYSFPSGHSAVSVAFFGFLTYLLIRERFGPFFVSFLAGATLVFLIGLSRIYLVEHYLSDVLNGYLVGALWALLGIWLAEWLLFQKKFHKACPGSTLAAGCLCWHHCQCSDCCGDHR